MFRGEGVLINWGNIRGNMLLPMRREMTQARLVRLIYLIIKPYCNSRWGEIRLKNVILEETRITLIANI